MANLNIGDKVRFLNAVGGGIVRRIEGEMAYVEEPDGFETPILSRECVVVEPALPRTSRKAVQETTFVAEEYQAKEADVAASSHADAEAETRGRAVECVVGHYSARNQAPDYDVVRCVSRK